MSSASTLRDTVPPQGKKYSPLLIAGHWLLLASIMVMVLTGIRIRQCANADLFPWPINLSPEILSGPVVLFHLMAGPVAIFSLLLLWMAWIGKNDRERSTVDRVVNHCLLTVMSIAVVSGFLLFKVSLGPDAYLVVRLIHAICGFLLAPFLLLVHMLLAFKRTPSSAIRIFTSGYGRLDAGDWRRLFLALLGTGSVVALALMWPANTTLQVQAIDAVDLDTAGKLPWQGAPVLHIPLRNGANFSDASGGTGATTLSMQGFHDRENIILRLSWADAVEDTNYFPWTWDGRQWQRGVSNEDDENRFYEDKLGLAFPLDAGVEDRLLGCAMQCHLGTKEVGYKTSSRRIDVWHWKRVRTQTAGQADDKYWDRDDPKNKNRGRFGDPAVGGGYIKNKTSDGAQPKYVSAGGGFNATCYMPAEDTMSLASLPDSLKVAGFHLPGCISSPFIGDRGDVSSRHEYGDGRHVLYLFRKLDTKSPYDIAFVPGRRFMFTAAAFDRSSKRHAYNYVTYYLKICP